MANTPDPEWDLTGIPRREFEGVPVDARLAAIREALLNASRRGDRDAVLAALPAAAAFFGVTEHEALAAWVRWLFETALERRVDDEIEVCPTDFLVQKAIDLAQRLYLDASSSGTPN